MHYSLTADEMVRQYKCKIMLIIVKCMKLQKKNTNFERIRKNR